MRRFYETSEPDSLPAPQDMFGLEE
jgi:hypothetical protein